MNRGPLRLLAPADDPGETWANDILAPVRRLSAGAVPADLDVSAAVMRRIAADRPAAAPAALPARWASLSWAASIVLGFVALGLLLATGGVMAFGSDQGARDLWALGATGTRLLAHGYGHLGLAAAGLAQAALAIAHGGWVLVETAAPLVRAAGFLAALAGVLSIVVSLFVVSRARATAPVAAGRISFRLNGGLS